MRRILGILAAALAAATSLSMTPASAHGSDGSGASGHARNTWTRHAVTRGYTQNWVWHPTGESGSGLNNKCVFIEARATLKGSWYYTYGDNHAPAEADIINWENLRVVDPSITARAWPETSNGGCDSTRSVQLRGALHEAYYSNSCKIDVDLAYGAGADIEGWSVGIEANPSYRCSKDKVGWADFSWSNRVTRLGIYGNGAALRFHDINMQSKSGGTDIEGAWDIYAGFGPGPVAHIRKIGDIIIKA